LAPFAPEVLTSVAENFILTRKWKTWPMPVEILGACKDEAARRAAETNAASFRKRKDDVWAGFRCVRADALIESGIGMQAAEQGWLDALWNFARVHERLPDRHEAQALRRTASGRETQTERSVHAVIDDAKWTPKAAGIRAALLGLHEQMRQVTDARRRRVADWAESNAAPDAHFSREVG